MAKIQQQNINNICQVTRGPVKRTFLKRNPTATNHHLWLLFSAPEFQRATCRQNKNTTCFVNLSSFQLYCELIISRQKRSKPNPTQPLKTHSCLFLCVFCNTQWAWPVLANSTVLSQQQDGFLLWDTVYFSVSVSHFISSFLSHFFISPFFVAQFDPAAPDFASISWVLEAFVTCFCIRFWRGAQGFV